MKIISRLYIALMLTLIMAGSALSQNADCAIVTGNGLERYSFDATASVTITDGVPIFEFTSLSDLPGIGLTSSIDPTYLYISLVGSGASFGDNSFSDLLADVFTTQGDHFRILSNELDSIGGPVFVLKDGASTPFEEGAGYALAGASGFVSSVAKKNGAKSAGQSSTNYRLTVTDNVVDGMTGDPTSFDGSLDIVFGNAKAVKIKGSNLVSSINVNRQNIFNKSVYEELGTFNELLGNRFMRFQRVTEDRSVRILCDFDDAPITVNTSS